MTLDLAVIRKDCGLALTHDRFMRTEVAERVIAVHTPALCDEVARLHRLLCDLTIGGSEFAHNPDRCAAWIKQELSTSLEAAVKAHGDANDLRRELVEARERIAEMEKRVVLDNSAKEC